MVPSVGVTAAAFYKDAFCEVHSLARRGLEQDLSAELAQVHESVLLAFGLLGHNIHPEVPVAWRESFCTR